MTTRRSALSYLTGGAVAAGALIAGGGLMRSCAPISESTTQIDLADMADGEMRMYVYNSARHIVIRRGDELTALNALCPNSNYAWAVEYESGINGLFCQHCTRRYDRAGQIVHRDGTEWRDSGALDLDPSAMIIEGLAIVQTDRDSSLRLLWSET